MVSGFESEQPLQQQSTSASFVGPVKCDYSVCPVTSVILSGCEQLH